MEMFQGIFDQGFSGLLEDSSKRTMPDYIEKLADSEIDYEPPKLEVPNIQFDKGSSLTRANELTSNGSRETFRENRFTAEKSQKIAQDDKIAFIDRTVKSMDDVDFEKIQASLLKSYSRELVNKYLQSKIKLILNKYAFLGFENLKNDEADLIVQSKKEFLVKRSTVHDVLDKFSKQEYVSSSVVKQYKELLESKRPLYVVAKFLFSLDDIKRKYFEEKEARITFQRDSDEKELSLRDIDNNTSRNSTVNRQKVYASMLNDYKQGIYSKLSKNEISKKLAKIYGFEKLQKFLEIHKDDISKSEHFYSRQAFDTDFANSALQGKEVELKSKKVALDSKTMLNFAFDLLTKGNELKDVESSLKKKFGIEATTQFLNENDYKLQRHYGQLGYLFIDSNIYANCDEMTEDFSKLHHAGSKLIYSLKSNSKCTGCSCNKQGECTKTSLLISNNPVVRSARAAKRVFENASSFVPQEHIQLFNAQIKAEESNLELISKFALGIKDALDKEKKNIGKQASKDRSVTMDMQEGFITPISYNVELFKQENESKIIDDVIGKI